MDELMMVAYNESVNIFLDNIEALLVSTGGMREIQQAIRSKDLANTVRVVTKALKKIGIPEPFSGHAYVKSAEESNAYRRAGNIHYLSKNYKDAILSYNRSLAYAPNNSMEVKLAYSNISAVLLNIEAFKACKLNIEAAQESGCPGFLRIKLEKRLFEANKYIEQDTMRDAMIRSEEDMLNYAEFDVARNSEIPCVSEDVCVEDGIVVAAKEIKSGTMVGLERAFVSFQDEINEYGACYQCHHIGFFFIPCEGCCKALFCSKECKTKCLEDYHRIECHIVSRMHAESKDINQHLNKLSIRAAIKMSLKLGWEKLGVASLKMGRRLLKKSSVAEAFDCNHPASQLCYDDTIDEASMDIMINRSLYSALSVYWLSRVPDYLPKDDEEKEKAIDTLSRVILHLNTTFIRQIAIPCSAIDYESHDKMRCVREVQRNVGWFSFTSKLAHSCEPNLLVVGFNDHVGLVALQRIKKGQPLTISYTEHFYDMNIEQPCPKYSRIRQKLIFRYLEYTCRCRVCLLEWYSKSHSEAKLTDSQLAVYNQFKTAMDSGIFEQQMEGIGAALDKLTKGYNTTQHRNVYEALRKTLNICQCAKTLNKIYGCIQSLHPYHDFKDYLD